MQSVFTPVLDDYLGSLVTGAKGVDKEAKKLQDQLLDIVGTLSMAFEHISSWQENEDDSGSITLPTQDVDGLYACLITITTIIIIIIIIIIITTIIIIIIIIITIIIIIIIIIIIMLPKDKSTYLLLHHTQ